MLDGCLEWQRVGLKPPEAITAATKEYFEQQDTFARFVADWCDLLPSARLQPDKLRSAYNAWADKNGEPTQSSKTFHKTIGLCRLPHVKQDKVNGVRWVFGIALKPPAQNRGRGDDDAPAPKPAAETTLVMRTGRSDDLPYTGPVVAVPDQGPDPLDEHGAPRAVPTQPANGGEPSLSRRRIQELADWYADEGHRRHNAGTLDTAALDAELHAILREEVASPEQVEIEFKRVMQVVFAQ